MSNNIKSSEKTKKPYKKSLKTKKKNEIITHLFKDKNGNLIFLKDYTDKQNKYLIPDGTEKVEIKRGDNIILPLNVDTEFTEYVGDLKKVTYAELEEDNCRFKTQYLRQQNF